MTALLALAALSGDAAIYALAFVAHVAQIAQSLPQIDIGDTVSWGALAGVFTPLLTSIVQRPTWSKPKRTIIGVIVSVVIGLFTCLADGTLDNAATLLATVTVVVVASAAAYKGLWQPSGVAPGLERATTPDSRHAA
jgi:hypothetical protein